MRLIIMPNPSMIISRACMLIPIPQMKELEAFIQEMEEKMPSSITVETFSSTGSQVSFSMRVASKSEAANTLIQLRTFDSLSSVTTTGIDEGEDGTVTMSVTCTYRNPALLDDAE